MWNHAVVVSNVTKKGPADQELCFLAHREADQDTPKNDVLNYACDFYDDIFQLFIGIQAAGPRLGPTSVDKGYHAIPHIASSDPAVPACLSLSPVTGGYGTSGGPFTRWLQFS